MCIGTFCSICGISYDTLQVIVSCICDYIYAFQILILIICIDIPFNLNALAFFVMILFITATPVGGCTQIRGEIYDFFCPGRESLKIRFKFEIGSILWRHLLIRLIWTSLRCIHGVFVYCSWNHENAPKNLNPRCLLQELTMTWMCDHGHGHDGNRISTLASTE